MTVLAVDVGGTKLAACRDGGDIHRVPTGADPWGALTALLDPLTDGITAMGVGCGGPMEWPAGVVSPVNIPAWRDGFPLRDRLSERYGVPVRLCEGMTARDVVDELGREHWPGLDAAA